MSNATEIIKSCTELGLNCKLIIGSEAELYINKSIEKFKPFKTSGHLSIGENSAKLSIEKNEFSYSEILPEEPAYIFFDQEDKDKNKVVMIENARDLGKITENSFGMEYFVSNKEIDYLIAVNWYVIEGSGSAHKWFTEARLFG